MKNIEEFKRLLAAEIRSKGKDEAVTERLVEFMVRADHDVAIEAKEELKLHEKSIDPDMYETYYGILERRQTENIVFGKDATVIDFSDAIHGMKSEEAKVFAALQWTQNSNFASAESVARIAALVFPGNREAANFFKEDLVEIVWDKAIKNDTYSPKQIIDMMKLEAEVDLNGFSGEELKEYKQAVVSRFPDNIRRYVTTFLEMPQELRVKKMTDLESRMSDHKEPEASRKESKDRKSVKDRNAKNERNDIVPTFPPSATHPSAESKSLASKSERERK